MKITEHYLLYNHLDLKLFQCVKLKNNKYFFFDDPTGYWFELAEKHFKEYMVKTKEYFKK
jgi:hypothetical protein